MPGPPVLVVDVGGSHVKILATGETERRRFESGPKLTPPQMIDGVRDAATGWECERGLERLGKKRWQKAVAETVEQLTAALAPDEIVIGGGNAKKLDVLPPRSRLGTNLNAFAGGFRLWD